MQKWQIELRNSEALIFEAKKNSTHNMKAKEYPPIHEQSPSGNPNWLPDPVLCVTSLEKWAQIFQRDEPAE